MTARRALVTAATALALAFAARGGPVAQVPVFRVSTDAVRVDVLVTDRRGAPVMGLDAADFEVLDNGVPQRVLVTAFEELRMHVVLALDTSRSVEGERFERLVSAVRGVLAQLKPADAATLVAFSHVIRLDALDLQRVSDPQAALRRLATGGYTAALDATWTALMSAERPGMRPLVILLSDGLDNRSWLRPDDVLDGAKRANAVVYAVHLRDDQRQRARSAGSSLFVGADDVSRSDTGPAGHAATVVGSTGIGADGGSTRVGPDEIGPPRENRGSTANFMLRLAEATGGRVIRADAGKDVRPALASVLDEFRRRYVLSYEPEGVNDGGWHSVEVRLKGKSRGHIVTARRGYERGAPRPTRE